MNKIDLNVRFAAIVLSAGLVSCAKENPTAKDQYIAPPPIIVSKGDHDLKTWNAQSDRSIDIQDAIDLSAAQHAKVEFISRCRVQLQKFEETFVMDSKGRVKIFEILPKEIHSMDLAAAKTDCEFQVTLFNQIGSRHIFDIKPMTVIDAQKPGVLLSKSGSDQNLTGIVLNQLDGITLRYKSLPGATVQLFCQDIRIPEYAFNQELAIKRLDFNNPELWPGRIAQNLKDTPVQRCRALIYEGRHLRQVSALFQLQLSAKALLISATQILIPPLSEREGFFAGGPMTTGFIVVTNPDVGGIRVLRIPKVAGGAKIEIFAPFRLADGPTQVGWNYFDLPRFYLTPVHAAGVVVQDMPDHWVLNLPPNTSARVNMFVSMSVPRVCIKNSLDLRSSDMAVTGSHFIHELNLDGKIVADFPIHSPRTSYTTANQFEQRHVKQNVRHCGW